MKWGNFALLPVSHGWFCMKLDLRGLIAGEISTLDIDYTITPDIDSENPLGNLCGVRFSSPMKVVGTVTDNAGYMRLSLRVSIDYVAPCARCLSDVCGTFRYDFERTVALKSVISTEDEDKLDEYVIIDEGFLDIDERLTELLEVDFPSKILCSEDCRGLCPKCGRNLNSGNCDCSKKEIDPRLLPLQKILDEMKNSKK